MLFKLNNDFFPHMGNKGSGNHFASSLFDVFFTFCCLCSKGIL